MTLIRPEFFSRLVKEQESLYFGPTFCLSALRTITH